MTRTTFVTGADRGLGFALCIGLLEQGWEVFAGQYLPEWHELSSLSSKYPSRLHIVPLDVSSQESVGAAARGECQISWANEVHNVCGIIWKALFMKLPTIEGKNK